MLNPEIIQIVIQGGAVGLLLTFGVGVYMLARRVIDLGSTFVSNHMAHLTDAVGRVERAVGRLNTAIDSLSKKE